MRKGNFSWRIGRIALALMSAISFLVLTTPTLLAAPDSCVAPSFVIEEVTVGFPGASLDEHLTGYKAERFVKLFNAIPPVSNIIADEVLIFSHPNYPTVRVYLFKDGCVRFMASILATQVLDMIGYQIYEREA